MTFEQFFVNNFCLFVAVVYFLLLLLLFLSAQIISIFVLVSNKPNKKKRKKQVEKFHAIFFGALAAQLNKLANNHEKIK